MIAGAILRRINAGEVVTVVGRCPRRGCRAGARLDAAGVAELGVYCVKHRARLRFARLTATYAAGVTCSAACRRALSSSCRCSCNGANHGLRGPQPERTP